MSKLFFLLGCILTISLLGLSYFQNQPDKNHRLEERKMPRAERKKARTSYFFNKLKDPKTNKIPDNVRLKETAFSAKINSFYGMKMLSGIDENSHDWAELGPANIGGRTRALALDIRNSQVVLTAGVAGGIWKSTNGGSSWQTVLSNGDILNISSIAQDPENMDIWYATMGEIGGGTSGGKLGAYSGNTYLGAGIYKSIDNGDSWSLMTYALDSPGVFVKDARPNLGIASAVVSPFNLTSKVIVHKFGGRTFIFVCTQYLGIWRSIDGGDSFTQYQSNY